MSYPCRHAAGLLILIVSQLWLAGCRMQGPEYRREIHSEQPAQRVRAIIHAGQVRDQLAVPLLVDRLEDEDEAVRMFAVLSLRKITGKDLGYRYYHSYELRAKAVKRWRNWLVESSAAAD